MNSDGAIRFPNEHWDHTFTITPPIMTDDGRSVQVKTFYMGSFMPELGVSIFEWKTEILVNGVVDDTRIHQMAYGSPHELVYRLQADYVRKLNYV